MQSRRRRHGSLERALWNSLTLASDEVVSKIENIITDYTFTNIISN